MYIVMSSLSEAIISHDVAREKCKFMVRPAGVTHLDNEIILSLSPSIIFDYFALVSFSCRFIISV